MRVRRAIGIDVGEAGVAERDALAAQNAVLVRGRLEGGADLGKPGPALTGDCAAISVRRAEVRAVAAGHLVEAHGRPAHEGGAVRARVTLCHARTSLPCLL